MSFYSKTPIHDDDHTDIWEYINIEKRLDDEEYIIEPQYQNRPDKLAEDRYGDSRLMFVFQLRNLEVLEDLIQDFKSGVTIRIPHNDSIKRIR